MPAARNYRQVPIIMYLSDVTEQIKKANCANKDGAIGFLQIVLKDTSNKLLKRNEFESKLYQHFPTSNEFQVLLKKQGGL